MKYPLVAKIKLISSNSSIKEIKTSRRGLLDRKKAKLDPKQVCLVTIRSTEYDHPLLLMISCDLSGAGCVDNSDHPVKRSTIGSEHVAAPMSNNTDQFEWFFKDGQWTNASNTYSICFTGQWSNTADEYKILFQCKQW